MVNKKQIQALLGAQKTLRVSKKGFWFSFSMTLPWFTKPKKQTKPLQR